MDLGVLAPVATIAAAVIVVVAAAIGVARWWFRRRAASRQAELARRKNVVGGLRQKYILSHDGLSEGMLAGTDPLPKDWVKAELGALGETWRQDVYW